jgi:hypothetical protein
MSSLYAHRKFRSAHARHDDVCNENIDRLVLLLGEFQGFQAILGCDYCKTTRA